MIQLQLIKSSKNIADAMTKPLPSPTFEKFQGRMMASSADDRAPDMDLF
jgi:hypothetical protein